MTTSGGIQASTTTLTAATEDVVTMTGQGSSIAITNHDATAILYVRFDGTAAVSAADENFVVLPGQTKIFPRTVGAASCVISMISSEDPTVTTELF